MAFGYRGDLAWLRRHPLLAGVGDGFGDGRTNGCVIVPGPFRKLTILFSDGEGWEHVSVSTPTRCPNWPEMSYVKALFWDRADAVMQLHPPEVEYVNCHEFCLHLWRPVGQVIPLPPSILVGPLGDRT